MRKHKGFSLIELLIVVAIILIIAAIAIPNLLRARISANESSAAASIRTINTAEVSYQSFYPAVGFPAAIATLGGASPCTPGVATGCLIDNQLTGGNKSGYTFTAAGLLPVNGANTQYVANGVPQTLNTTGVKGFCSTEDNAVRFISPAGAAEAHDPCQALALIGQ
ncbi:MAG TPA: prepilin-type N-terminal cleavage/methylation domain-containing protein [Candidatus Sulfotelmatobacter sp.]|nr:prepilin-type N-terminal cleavage/methylation domain-containing protein [Candidatus Sulfotelmatobacter sp.]